MEPKYSILLCNQNLKNYEDLILSRLLSGIKVIWFGTGEEADALFEEHRDFAKGLFLQVMIDLMNLELFKADPISLSFLMELHCFCMECPIGFRISWI